MDWAVLLLSLLFVPTCLSDGRLSNERQLQWKEDASDPAFSPDGRFLLFTSNDKRNGKACGQIYSLALQEPGQSPIRLSNGIGSFGSAVFHPNGRSLFVSSDFHRFLPLGNRSIEDTCDGREREHDIFELNELGNFKRQVTSGLGSKKQVAVSPDGHQLAFVKNDAQLWITNTDGKEQSERLLVDDFTRLRLLEFSPDGRRLLFSVIPRARAGKGGVSFANSLHLQATGNSSILEIELDGTNQKPLTSSELNVEFASFHPDGNGLLFISGGRLISAKEGGQAEEVGRIDVDGPFALSADGSKLAWTNEGRLWIADLPTELLGKRVESEHKQTEELSNSSRDFLRQLDVKAGEANKTHFPQERHLTNVQQLTYGGQNAEGYFNFDGRAIVFQAAGKVRYGTNCDQIYALRIDQKMTPATRLQRLSTGLGACTCAYWFPDDKTSIHASTFASVRPEQLPDSCPTKTCQSERAKTDPVLKQLCNTSYTWDLFDYDIYKVNEYGNIIQRLTNSPGYDAEGAVSPDGKRIVFTSVRTGDPELWLMDADGGNLKQAGRFFSSLTNTLGYDGGPFFSPDGMKIGFRASRPKGEEEISKYKQLLSYNLVEPLAMELYTINVDGSGLRKITELSGSNWAPFYLADNRRLIFSTNFNETGRFGAFDLFVVDEEGKNPERITYNEGGFDAFPMQSRNGRKLIWGSSRNGASPYDLNLFLADWVE